MILDPILDGSGAVALSCGSDACGDVSDLFVASGAKLDAEDADRSCVGPVG